jgi:hypothetical protein
VVGGAEKSSTAASSTAQQAAADPPTAAISLPTRYCSTDTPCSAGNSCADRAIPGSHGTAANAAAVALARRGGGAGDLMRLGARMEVVVVGAETLTNLLEQAD